MKIEELTRHYAYGRDHCLMELTVLTLTCLVKFEGALYCPRTTFLLGLHKIHDATIKFPSSFWTSKNCSTTVDKYRKSDTVFWFVVDSIDRPTFTAILISGNSFLVWSSLYFTKKQTKAQCKETVTVKFRHNDRRRTEKKLSLYPSVVNSL